ncbi:hypothetical protein K7432_011175 [Basidiobolus ranarum]|uniref:Uncharacterized protein n=1 Tax=Basidiobolus ranarum TaxID=34480 RepID=A0ABR2VUE0_9FUNG
MDELHINLQASTGYIQASFSCVLGNHELMKEGKATIKISHQNYDQLKTMEKSKSIVPCAPKRQLYLESKMPVSTAAV